MALPEDYLLYPHRRYGMDQDRYGWVRSDDRPKLNWPDGKLLGCMIVVPVEFHMLNPSGKPFKHPGAMVTPYPDLRHFTSRDYGARVGVFRILKVLKDAGLKATFAVNAAMLDRTAPLIEAILTDGHEIAAHGLDTDHIHWGGIDPDTEKRWIGETRERFDRRRLSPRAWMSPARQQSFQTLDLLAEAGFDICLDWEQDTTPTPMRTSGGAVWAVPLSNELDDRLLLIERRQSEEAWADQIIEAIRFLKAESARFPGQMLGFTLTPYVSGQPFRIRALRRLAAALGQDEAVWSAGASELVDHLKRQTH